MTPASFETENLYRTALLKPAVEGADKLLVISGYVTPAMVSKFLSDVNKVVDHSVSVDLVVGMVGYEGIALPDHAAFLTLQEAPPAGAVKVSYTVKHRSVHTKLYVWLKNGTPVQAFAGSSNFTQNGFLVGKRKSHHSELLTEVSATDALAEFLRIESDSLRADYPDLESEVSIGARRTTGVASVAATDDGGPTVELIGVDFCILPLVALKSQKGTVRGEPHKQWGLNWGQRKNRNRNQAVIPIPAIARKRDADFFPRGVKGDRPQFLITTDDGKSMFFTVSEQGDKALHSVPSNSLVGEYFRNRLGIASEAEVTLDDLLRNGSRFVKIFRTEEESYFMEYSPEADAEGAEIYGL